MVDTNEVKPSTANPQRVGTWPLVWLLEWNRHGVSSCVFCRRAIVLHDALPRSHGAAIQRRRVHQTTTWFPSLGAVDPLQLLLDESSHQAPVESGAQLLNHWNTATTTLMTKAMCVGSVGDRWPPIVQDACQGRLSAGYCPFLLRHQRSCITVLSQSGSQPHHGYTLYPCAATVSAAITFMCDRHACLLPKTSQRT